jgi:hypothetical protein
MKIILFFLFWRHSIWLFWREYCFPGCNVVWSGFPEEYAVWNKDYLKVTLFSGLWHYLVWFSWGENCFPECNAMYSGFPGEYTAFWNKPLLKIILLPGICRCLVCVSSREHYFAGCNAIQLSFPKEYDVFWNVTLCCWYSSSYPYKFFNGSQRKVTTASLLMFPNFLLQNSIFLIQLRITIPIVETIRK